MEAYGRPISLSIYIGVEVALDSSIISSKEERQVPLTFPWDKAPEIDYESVLDAHNLHMQYAITIHRVPLVNIW